MIIDLLCLLIAVYAFYMGYTKGIIQTIFNTLSIFIGLLVALKLSPVLINLLENIFNKESTLIFILGFVLTFIVVLILIRFIGKKLEKLFKTIKLNFINKLAGGAVLSFVFLVCFSYVIFFLDKTHLITDSTKQKSFTYPVLQVLPSHSKQLMEKVKPFFKEFWDKTVEIVDGIKEQTDE